ncbi:Uncharacterised protein [Vibrio cholerae]|uniref:Uncharacterized protein n=1 Tax=Vibrio cholerae TaxID=666 RepID=A0A655RZG6_VIBCL|nr:Uncharacterised protein [Vibrio cholerae]CSB08140.1 Uncharacterised protein [Vibrio cholerae]CSB08855.1 Uncharacterised protein [Vibrio cholerae]CSB57018.1 Uncharacterised protein [Vibrio cholerae]CSC56361.1 Uncharacterised protein [Vibrio cholerae]
MPKSRCSGGKKVIACWFWWMVPEVGRSNPAMARNKVVLPQPEGPRKQTNSPFSIDKLISFNAVNEPNCFTT